MSRIGRKIIELPKGVSVKQEAGFLRVKGPKGELQVPVAHTIGTNINGSEVSFTRANDLKQNRALHGLTRALANSAVVGVTEGFTKKLEIVGVGYRAEMRGKTLVLALGFSHPIVFSAPPEITISAPVPTQIVITGTDKQLVGQVAANIRAFRPPEPYNGKGVKYDNEVIRRKAGKTAAK